MKALFYTLAIALSFSLNAAKINQAAPTFTLTDSNGVEVSLADFKGKKVILEWTNHQCPYVVKHYSGNMQNLQTSYTSQDVVWLSIISSAPGKQGYIEGDEANQLTKSRNAAPTHVLFDPEGSVGKMYNAKTTPHMYIIDEEGSLRYMGGIDSIKSTDVADIEKATNFVTQAMDELMANESVSQPIAAPYGCSIKYKG